MSEAKRPRRDRTPSRLNTIILAGVIMLFVTVFLVVNGILASETPGTAPSLETTATPTLSKMSTPSPSAEVAPSVKALANTPTPEPTPTLAPVEEVSQPISTTPSRLVYKAAGIDLPIAPMDQETGPFVPPTERDMSYWLTHRKGYILAHSAETEKWPFNALTTASRPGDVIELVASEGRVQYQVTDVSFYPKYDLEVDGKTPVWDIDDSLIRLIGCKDGDVWQQVTVVTAKLL